MLCNFELPVFFQSTNLCNNENPTNAESDSNPKTKTEAGVKDEVETEVDILILVFLNKTEQANSALEDDKEYKVLDEKLIEASENILLQIWD